MIQLETLNFEPEQAFIDAGHHCEYANRITFTEKPHANKI